MDVTVRDNREQSRFEVRVGDDVAGFASYELRGSTILFVHTEVAPEYEGRGLGSALARAALEAARDRGLGVLPYCPFIRSYIARHPEHTDLVPAEQRSRFHITGV